MMHRALLFATALAASCSVALGIYPDDHWSYAVKLTSDTFESTIQNEIDAGKTMFAVTRAFAGNEKVAFGDVNLSEDQIRGNHEPGSGGWPTIRYFNSDTGIEGASYEKKSDKAMCDELGEEEMMTAYVEEAGNTSLCDVVDGSGCDEREMGYIVKMKAKTEADWRAQMERIAKMEGGSMKSELKQWMMKRKKILKQLVAAGGASPGSDEM